MVRNLSDFDFLNKSAVATLDELTWWTHTLKAGRVEEVKKEDRSREGLKG